MALRALLPLLLFIMSVASLRAEDGDFITRWIAAQQRVGDVSVGFKQTRTLPALKAPIVSDGRLWRMADGRFRWELGSPASTILLFDNESLHLQEAAQAPWAKLSPNEARMRMWTRFLSSKDLSAEALTKDFNTSTSSQQPGVTTLTLQPKGLMVRKHLKQIDLQIESSSLRLRQIRMVQGDGATLLMSFDAPQTLSADDLRTLSFTPPS